MSEDAVQALRRATSLASNVIAELDGFLRFERAENSRLKALVESLQRQLVDQAVR